MTISNALSNGFTTHVWGSNELQKALGLFILQEKQVTLHQCFSTHVVGFEYYCKFIYKQQTDIQPIKGGCKLHNAAQTKTILSIVAKSVSCSRLIRLIGNVEWSIL